MIHLLTRDDRVRIQAALRRARASGTLSSLIKATGVASSPKLADAAMTGMWLYLGVEIDPVGLRPQPVALLEIPDDQTTWHVVLVSEANRLLYGASTSKAELLRRVAEKGIFIEWTI